MKPLRENSQLPPAEAEVFWTTGCDARRAAPGLQPETTQPLCAADSTADAGINLQPDSGQLYDGHCDGYSDFTSSPARTWREGAAGDAAGDLTSDAAAVAGGANCVPSGAFVLKIVNSACCAGVDVPGVGQVHSTECPAVQRQATLPGRAYVAGHVSEPLRKFIDEECGAIMQTHEDALDGLANLYALAHERRRDRDALLAQLIFAARELAQSRIVEQVERHPYGYSLLQKCAECGEPMTSDGTVAHLRLCRVGRAMDILTRLITLAEFSTQEVHVPAQEGREAPGEKSDALYGEPWRAVNTASGAMLIFDAEGVPIARTVSASPAESRDWADRIVECVNFCSGRSRESLAVSPKNAGGAQ